MSVVFNSTGATVAQYAKHHLFETETKCFVAGPFALGNVFTVRRRASFVAAHLLQGLYPILHNDWSQLEAFKAAGADAALWAVEDHLPIALVGKNDAKHAAADVIGSQILTGGVAMSATGKSLLAKPLPLAVVPGYTGKASIKVTEI